MEPQIKKKQNVDMSSGWKSFEELKSKYSEAEIKFEKRRRTVGLWLGPLIFFLILFMPTPLEMTLKAQKVLAITAWTVIWWIGEPIPIPATGLLPFILIPSMGIMPAQPFFAVLGHPNNFLMIGAYIFIGAMVTHGVTKRMALWILSRKFAAKSPMHLIAAFTFAIAVISAFLSNIPATMLFLVIGSGISEALGLAEDHPFSKALKFGSAYGSQAGGVITPIGAANVNFLSIGLIASMLQYQVRFADWMMFGIPFGIIIFIVIMIYFRGIFNVKLDNLEKAREYAQKELNALGILSKGEKNAIFLVVLAVVLWLIPSFAAAIYGNNAPITQSLDRILNGAIVAIIVALLGFLIPIDWKERKFTINWTSSERQVNWGAIIIVTTGFALGNAMNAEDVGLIRWMADNLSSIFANASPWVIILGFTIIGTVLTQFISNVPAVGILTSVSIPVAIATGLNPIALALTICIACQQSYAMPIAAPQMALVYGSGGIRITEFIKVGTILSIVSIPFVAFFIYYWCNMLFPYVAQ